MNRCLLCITACAVFLVGSGPPSALAQSSANFKIKKSVMAMGGPGASSTNYKINNAFGQAGPAWNSFSTGYSLSSGFLAAGQGAPAQFSILVDGLKDDFYGTLSGPDDGYLQIRYYAWNDNGKPVNDADLSAKVWTAWDDQWFYLYEEVKDNTLSGNAVNVWEEDGLELLFDPQPTDIVNNSVWLTRLTALGIETAGVVAADNMSTVPDSQKKWVRKTVSGGYELELALSWSAIVSGSKTITPAVGHIFGMGINQHDNDGGAVRRATIQWAAVLMDAAWDTPKYLGTVKLLPDHKAQFIPTNNMTGVTNPVPYDGSDYTRTGVERIAEVPSAFRLDQNYPNPFNPETQIRFEILKPGPVKLAVYDLTGKEVAILFDGMKQPGTYSMILNAKDLTSGMYLCRLQSAGFTTTRKITILK